MSIIKDGVTHFSNLGESHHRRIDFIAVLAEWKTGIDAAQVWLEFHKPLLSMIMRR